MILELRRTRCLGVKRLRHELRRLYGLQLSPATIHKTLVRHALNVLPRRKRNRHKPRRYSRPAPGDRVQMDTCKIRPGLYQFTAIDDCTRYLVAGLARRRTAAATLAFLDQVLDEMPFAIQRLQTDRGAEFFAEDVQRRLMAEAIRFRPVPPRSPHLNGKVERVQRTVLEEFWPTVYAKAPEYRGPACRMGAPLQLGPATRGAERLNPDRPSVRARQQDTAARRGQRRL